MRSSTACGARAARHLDGKQRCGSLTFLAFRAASRDADTEPSTGSLLWQLRASSTLTRISAYPARCPASAGNAPASVSPAASCAGALAPPRGSREVGADLSSRKTHTGVRAYRLIPSFHCKAVLNERICGPRGRRAAHRSCLSTAHRSATAARQLALVLNSSPKLRQLSERSRHRSASADSETL